MAGLPMPSSDSNTLPIAIQSGLAANQLAKPMLQAAKDGTKLPMDQFMATVKAQTSANMPIADALQQQSFFTRMVQKIPFVGPRITQFLGADAPLNNVIGQLGKKELGGVGAADVTRIAYQGGDVEKNLIAAGVPDSAAKQIADAAASQAAGVATATATSAGAAAASTLSNDAISGVLKASANGGMLAGKSVSTEAIQNALKQGGNDVVGSLRALGLRADAAKAIAKQAAGSAATDGAQQAAQTATKDGVEAASKAGGIKGLFGKLLGGAKGNFIIAGIFSIGSNAISLATGKMNLKQFIALSAMDTGAYGLIGLGSAAAGGAIAGAIGQALIPIPGLGFICGLGLGILGGWLYEKFLRNPVKNMLGPSGGSAPSSSYNPGVQPGAYQDPYAQPGAAQQPQSGAPAAYPQTGAPAAPVDPNSGMSYDQALQYLNQMGGQG